MTEEKYFCTWHSPTVLSLYANMCLVAGGQKKRICPKCGHAFWAELWRNSIHTKPPINWDDAKELVE